MSVSHVAYVLFERLLLLSRYSGSMTIILFALTTALALSFQIPKTNGVGQHGVRQSIFGVDYRIRQMGWISSSSSPSVSSSYRIPPEKNLLLYASRIPSYSDSMRQQQRSTGIEVKSRDMASLSEWSRSCEIVLADGIELTEDLLGDWSLTTTKSIKQGSSILTVPSQVILASDVNGDSYLPYYNETDMRNVHVWIESELESGSQSKQDYLPEYMLVYKLIREVYLDTNSRWHPWLQSLPTKFSTGLFLDDVERNHVERMTGEYMKVQSLQHQACLDLFKKLVSSQEVSGSKALIPTEFYKWILTLQQDSNKEDTRFDNLVKWAFTVVFTRSWRSPDRKQAQIVPLGDLANHDSQFANLKPGFRQTDGAFQFFVTNDIDVVGATSPELYLSYGLTYAPSRYLVLFGFCDVTAAYIDARLDFLKDNDDCKWPTTLEPSQLVVSTLNGALSEEVWIAFLYKILQEKDPELLARIRNAFDDDTDNDDDDDDDECGDRLVETVLETWEFAVGMEIQAYYQRLLETDFMPIKVTERDLAEHPNLSMIVNYNLFIRETYLNVLEHVNMFLTQCNEFQELLSTAKGKNPVDNVTAILDENLIPEENSILRVKLNSSEESNQTSLRPRSESVGEKFQGKSLQSMSKQFVSSEPNYIESTDIKGDKSIASIRSKKKKISAQTVPKTAFSNATSSFSTVNLDQQTRSVRESQEMIDFNTTPEFNSSKMDRLPYSEIKIPREGSDLNKTSRFSFENFSLQSYSNATTKSYDDNSNPRSYNLDQTIPKGVDKTATPSIPTGNFNPQFYSGSQIGAKQESIDLTSKSTSPSGKIESESYSNATPKFPNNENSNPQSYSLDQPSEEKIESTVAPRFNYENLNSQRPAQEKIDSAVISGFPNGNTDSQSDSFDQTIDQTISTQERISSTVISDFSDRKIDSRSYSDGTTMSIEERISSTAMPDFPDGNIDLQSDSFDQTIDQTTSTQEGVDLTTSYAQSLVLDQRGSGGGTQTSKQSNQGISSTPTTYAEYVQQRQEESTDTSDQSCSDVSTIERFCLPLEDFGLRANDDGFIQYDGDAIDQSEDFQIY